MNILLAAAILSVPEIQMLKAILYGISRPAQQAACSDNNFRQITNADK